MLVEPVRDRPRRSFPRAVTSVNPPKLGLPVVDLLVSRSGAGLDALFHAHPQPMWIVEDKSLRFLAVNDAAIRMYGYSRRQFLGMTVSDLQLPEEVSALKRHLKRHEKEFQTSGPWHTVGRRGDQLQVEVATTRVEYRGADAILASITDVTARVALASAFSKGFRSSPSPMLIARRSDRRLVDANDIFLEAFGFTREEVIGKSVGELDIVSTVEMKRIWASVSSGSANGLPVTLHGRLGSPRNVILSVEPIEHEGELRLLLLLVDVTEAHRTAEALYAAENTLRALLESAAEGVLTTDGKGRITFANAKLQAMFGYTAHELLTQPIEALVPDRYGARHTRLSRTYLQHPTPLTLGEGRNLFGRRKDSVEFPIEVSLSPVQTASGTVVMAIVTDISERKHAEEDLRRSARRLAALREIDRAILRGRTIPETAAVAVVHLCNILPCGRASVVMVEEAGARIVAVHGEGAGLTPSGTLVPLAPPSALSLVASGKRAHVKLDRRARRAPIGEHLHSIGLRSYIAIPLRISEEQTAALAIWPGARGGFADEELEVATEVADLLAIAIRQSQLLEESRKHAQQLQVRVDERTAELQASNEDLQAFAYSVSHDLRAPLRAMEGFGQALLEDYGATLDAEAVEFIEHIVDASKLMDDLIQDLLAYSHIARGHLHVEPVDLATVVREALEQLAGEIERRDARVETPCTSIRVLADRTTLTQAIVNLVSNGFKFVSPGRRPRVTIRWERRGERVRVSVSDNGIGINADHHDRIFKIFERLHPVEVYEGTGIGLALVKKAVENMHGRVGVKSQVGHGSTFWLELDAAP